MGHLSFIEKRTINRLFGIRNGYIFEFLVTRGTYNKNITHDMILDVCGIDIYKDPSYSSLSQEKCVNKVFSEQPPAIIGRLLQTMLDFFRLEMGNSFWSDEDSYDYSQVEGIVERLKSTDSVEIPEALAGNMQLLQQDIEKNITSNTPELVLDRLHTFATQFIREICVKHGVSIAADDGKHYSLNSLVGKLKKFYESNSYFSSEFCLIAIRNSIDLFAKFNDIRNSSSFSHPNPVLEKCEAEYVVKTIVNTLRFIEKIENQVSQSSETGFFPELDEDNELPF
jgi:hypothetical protein